MEFSTMISGGSLCLEIECPRCRDTFETEDIDIPAPNLQVERLSDSSIDDYTITECICGQEIRIEVYSSLYGVSVDIEGNPNFRILSITDNEELYYDYETPEDPYEIFKSEVNSAKEILSKISGFDFSLQQNLMNMIAAKGITILETYLLDTLLVVISHENKFKKFTKEFVQIKTQTFPLNEIFDKIEEIEKIVKDEIHKIQFHNLTTVNRMYSAVGVKFPPMGEIYRWIKIRHDIVHRNGKTIEGKFHNITKEELESLFSNLETVIADIENNVVAEIQNQ